MEYSYEAVQQAELDAACNKLRKALTPYSIARYERKCKEFELYIQLKWEGKK